MRKGVYKLDNTETYETTIVDETQISEAPTIPTELITVTTRLTK